MKIKTIFTVFLLLFVATSAKSQNVITRKPPKTQTTPTKPTKPAKPSKPSPMNTNNIYVSTEEQFFNALSSNRTIIIQKSLNLSSITDYELKLTGYSNLSIKGVNPSIRLGVSKGENLVLSFDSCQNISISNLVMGHEGVLDCGAGVLMFSNCSGVNISNCDIYGCGYYGVVFDRSKDAVCSNSTIHNCWLFNVDIEQSTNIKFYWCPINEK